jgi:hypothetical protein
MKDRDRHAELGARLRGLEVPEHAPGFFEALEETLRTEEATAGGRAPQPGRAVAPRTAPAPKRRAWLRLAWVPIPVAAVVLALLWAFAGPLGIDFLRPQTASAKEISQRVATAVAEAQALRGTLVMAWRADEATAAGSGSRDEMRWSFVTTAEGDLRLSGLTVSEELAYDHLSGVERVLSVDDEGVAHASELSGLATGLPDPAPADNMLSRQLGAVVRALRDSPEASVTEAIYEGRRVWVLDADVQANRLSTSSGDHLVVTVDQATGFPIKSVETRAGEFVQEFRLDDLEVDPRLSPDTFALSFPADAEVYRDDAGFRPVALTRVATDGAAVVGYAPVLPTWVPDGFALAGVRVAELGRGTGKEGMNPPSAGVVSVVYRRGFDRLIVTTRLVGEDASLWSDPLASGEGFIDTPEMVTLSSGAFAGSRVELVLDARAVPHLWAVEEALVLTVSGDLTRVELLAVAESFVRAE